jgi:hypothetical protein
MPILVTDLAFAISDTPTLLFMEHCLDHWKDLILQLAPIVQDTGFQWLHTGLCVPWYVVLSVI